MAEIKDRPDTGKNKKPGVKKTSTADEIGARGCVTIIIVVLAIAAAVYLWSAYGPEITIPQIVRFYDGGFKIEWPFGKSANKNAGDESKSERGDASGDDAGGGDASGDDAGGGDGVGGGSESYDGNGAADGDGDANAGVYSADASANGLQGEAGDAILSEYAALISKHGELSVAIIEYKNGDLDINGLKTVCEDANVYFSSAINRLNHINVGDDKIYLNLLMAAVMSDQIACADIIRNIDGDIAAIIDNEASNYNRNADDANDAYKAFAELLAR